ncbi:alpha/beta hydrolase [Acetobacter sp.]|jgi:acetyl esterase/lipase|uniref:alpha/beta hydrolase n=1 Tax=Acetobacter sp. TaxID=440 RepID=UPI0025C5867A|nr:alpha/beta hydrolase [Acetobacter sp.]MCH4090209.1 alpha/beta hydrolase [Acetobacter sp.]MCI1298903.1 alpha/beta hydrolase [Acetobacter sp.]MCI1314923.1 alpha/beta hydrolase [Acetobacter sp.]
MTEADFRRFVDPELRPLLDRLGPPSLDLASLPEARAKRQPPPGMKDTLPVLTAARLIPGMPDDPDVRVLVVEPAAASDTPRPAMLHIHGGGFVMGTPDAMSPMLRRWALELDCVIVSVEYRLAPEHPFPAPLEDCYAALIWMAENAAFLRIDPTRIGVAGESAGGGLAAGLALLCRQRGGPALAFQNLQYPMLDDRTVLAKPTIPGGGAFLWTPEMNVVGWECYLGIRPGGEGISPFAAPARAASLESLPPAYIGVGSIDLFLREDLDYATRLMQAGVSVELEVFPGAFHAFELEPRAGVSIRSSTRRLDAMRRAMRLHRPD